MCGHALLATGNGLEVADMRRRREQDWFGIHVPTSGPVNLSFKSYPPSSEDSISLTQEVGVSEISPANSCSRAHVIEAIQDKFEYS